MSRVKKPRVPFKLYDIPFDSTADLNREVYRRAQNAYQPQLQDVNRQIQSEGRKTTGREQQIVGWNQAFKDQLGQAYDQASKALTTLQGSALPTEEQNSVLNAAMASQGRVADEAQRMGVTPTPGSPAVTQAVQQGNTATGNYLGGLGANILAGADMYRNTVPQTQQNAQLAAEAGRHQGVLTDLTGKRTDILGTIGPARAQARADIMKEILGQRAQQFQEIIANKEFGLKERGLDLQSKLGWAGVHQQENQLDLAGKQFKWSKYVDRKKIQQGQQQLDDAANQAAGAANEGDATALANTYARGAAAVDAFLAPNEGDKTTMNKRVNGKKRKVTGIDNGLYRKNRTPDQLYAALSRLNMSDSMIYQLMETVTIPGFKYWVKLRRGDYSKGGPYGSGHMAPNPRPPANYP